MLRAQARTHTKEEGKKRRRRRRSGLDLARDGVRTFLGSLFPERVVVVNVDNDPHLQPPPNPSQPSPLAMLLS